MKNAIAFLRSSCPPDYGRRLARLRWARSFPASRRVEITPRDAARDGLAGSEAWLIVRDEMALPWPLARFPLAGPGRVLVAGSVSAGGAPVHTLREFETHAPPFASGAPEGSETPATPPALSFRVADFPPGPEETVAAFLERLLESFILQERDAGFRALSFGDASEFERPELTRHLPEGCRRLLDVGCGAGGSSAALKARVPALHVTGVEKDERTAARAQRRLDRVLVGDADRILEGLAGDGERFDAFLFADVLEHLEDPGRVLFRARGLAAPAATLVASVPNAGHLSLVRDLVLGRFDPVPAGLADVGHLRWFTRRSLQEAMEEAGFTPCAIEPWPGFPAPRAEEFLSRFSRWPGLDRESLATYQWIAVARLRSGQTGVRGVENGEPRVAAMGRDVEMGRPPEPAASKGADESTLLCSLEAPAYHQLQFDATNRFRGMVLDYRGRIVRRLRVSIDGKAVGEFRSDLSSEDLARRLPRLPAAGNCRFEWDLFVPAQARAVEFDAVLEDDRTEPLLRFDLAEIRESSERLEALKRGLHALPMPGPEIVFLTQGHRDVAGYRDSIIPGLFHVRKYLARAGVDFGQIATVLDFGCGTGRMLAGWHLDNSERRLFGCDTNAVLIEWARQNLPASIRLDHTSMAPPLPYPGGQFDLVSAISVLTHLRFRTQQLWEQELARVIRPGGVLLLTLHGEPYVRLFLPERLEEYERAGHIETESGVDGANESASFHEPRIVAELFSEFEMIEHFPVGRLDGRSVVFPLAAFQDVYVLRRRD